MATSADRIQRAVSEDGTVIRGRVHGQGPPLVLVHGGMEDGDLLWGPILPHLVERFTCYLPSTRGRGLSDGHRDLSPDRLVEDITAFVDSIGEPVFLVGESSGGMWALGAAARTDAVTAVAVYEPVVFEAQSEEVAAGLEETLRRVGGAAAEGRFSDAARQFAEPLLNREELAAMSASDYFDASRRYVPVLLREIDQAQRCEAGPTDPAVLERIEAPLLLLYGTRTALREWFEAGVGHVDRHVPDSRVRQVEAAGHWAPMLRPEAIADEVVRFFEWAGAAT